MKLIALTGLCVAILLGGCWGRTVENPAPPPPATDGEAEYLRQTAIEPEAEGQTEDAVESALLWSEKYSQAVERLIRTQQENHALQEANRKLRAEAEKLQGDLTQAKKELGDANAMLVDMRRELENWKTNVLGFRDEMRDAQRAQLDALIRVLKLLGGAEVAEPTSQPATAGAEKGKELASGS